MPIATSACLTTVGLRSPGGTSPGIPLTTPRCPNTVLLVIDTAIPRAETMTRFTNLFQSFAPARPVRVKDFDAATKSRSAVVALIGILMLPPAAKALDLSSGLYQIEVMIALPNVQNVAVPISITQCITAENITSGRAFFVLSDNPLQACELVDYRPAQNSFTYRIVCPGPNRGSAFAEFETTTTTYRGAIKMNMGGKNMTMSETQLGKRVGNCP